MTEWRRRVRGPLAGLCLMAALHAGLVPACAAAQERRCLENLSDAQVQARYRMVYRAFERQEKHARWWYFGWLGVFSGLLAMDSVFTAVDFRNARPRFVAALVGNGISVLAFTIFPRTGLAAATATRRLGRRPADTPAERRDRLRFALKLLERSATWQRRSRSWFLHAGGFAWGLGTSLLLGLKYDDTEGALILAFASPAVNELRIWSGPTTSMETWQAYRDATEGCEGLAPSAPERGPRVDVQAGLGRFVLTVRWF